jgi:hypothetical protein
MDRQQLKETNMKKTLIALALVFAATTSHAWQLKWDATTGAAGYRVSYKTLAATTYTQVDVGNVTTFNLDNINLVQGQRYELFVQGYAGTPKSYSGESDHLRWTYPATPIIVEMMGQPVNIVIQP